MSKTSIHGVILYRIQDILYNTRPVLSHEFLKRKTLTRNPIVHAVLKDRKMLQLKLRWAF